MTLIGALLFFGVYALFLLVWIALGRAAARADRMVERARAERVIRADRGQGWRS